MEFNYQKYLIKKIDDIYKQIKMAIGLPLTFEANDFIKQTISLTNISNIIRFKTIILDPLKKELNNNKLVFSPETHLCVKKWNDTYKASVTMLEKLNDVFQTPIIENESTVSFKICDVNKMITNNIVVNLYGEYRLEFLNFEMSDLTNQIVKLFDADINQLSFKELLDEETKLFSVILKQINKSKKEQIIDNETKIRFINELEYFNELLSLLLSITYKIIIEFSLFEIDLNEAYFFIKDFK